MFSILLSVIVSNAVVIVVVLEEVVIVVVPEEVVMIGRDLDLNFNPNWLSSMVLGGKSVYIS